MSIIHYDLFAGIGGFSYALDKVFYEEKVRHIFCECEAFPTAVLKKHWPDSTYYGDIADLASDTERTRLERIEQDHFEGHAGQRSGKRGNKAQKLVVLTGGFPCQPFSHAGRRQGTADDRYLWPQMFAVIRNVRPDWVIAENVRGLVTWNEGMVLETVCADLESEGYEVQPLIIPACAVGAPHRRDRVWIIAHNGREHGEPRNSKALETSATFGTTSPEANQQEHQYTWANDWREVAFATCHDGVDDGLPRRMGGITISRSRWRKEALKAYGNSIVPQVAMQIYEAIKLSQLGD